MYRDRKTGTYPLDQWQVAGLRKNMSLPSIWGTDTADYVGVDLVVETEKPVFDLMTQDVVEVAPVEVLGVWTQQWEITKLSNEGSAAACQHLRQVAYPPATDYLDAIVKGDTVQAQTYIDACLAVKAKYPKP